MEPKRVVPVEPKRVLLWGQLQNIFGTIFFLKECRTEAIMVMMFVFPSKAPRTSLAVGSQRPAIGQCEGKAS